jgi:hypothetical protein
MPAAMSGSGGRNANTALVDSWAFDGDRLGICRSSRQGCRIVPKLSAVAIKAPFTTKQPHQGAFSDRRCPAAVLVDQRAQSLTVPCLAMLDVQDGMQIKISSLAVRQADTAQTFRYQGRATGRGELDYAKRTYGMPRVSP